MYGIGAGQNEGKILSTQSSTGPVGTLQWPALEDSVAYTDYSVQALLDSLTLAQLNSKKIPVTVLTVTATTYTDPLLGSFKCGDDFRIRITDDRFTTPLDVTRRLSRYDVVVGDAGPERVTYTFVQTTN